MSNNTTSTFPLHIRFRDLDSYGHVNNAVYLTYLEEARIMYFKEKVGDSWDWEKHGILLVKHEINYLVPVLLNDKAEITLTISHVGIKSFTLDFEINKQYKGQNVRCTFGSTVAVCFDHSTQTTTAIPEAWKSILRGE